MLLNQPFKEVIMISFSWQF